MSNRTSCRNLIVVDLEATCERDRKLDNPEIIEIGVAKLEIASGSILRKDSYIITPMYNKISDYCTELTGYTQEHIDKNGRPFVERLNTFKKDYALRNTAWASWGDYDRWTFKDNCRLSEVDYPFSSRHLNLKTVVAMLMGWPKELGLINAMNELGMEFEGLQHTGVDDAFNTARVFTEAISTTINGRLNHEVLGEHNDRTSLTKQEIQDHNKMP